MHDDQLAGHRAAQVPWTAQHLYALCRHYAIDNATREAHAALVNADILARVYLAMTGRER